MSMGAAFDPVLIHSFVSQIHHFHRFFQPYSELYQPWCLPYVSKLCRAHRGPAQLDKPSSICTSGKEGRNRKEDTSEEGDEETSDEDWCQSAFMDIKSALQNSPILVPPNFNQPFKVQTDASDLGLGSWLTHPR